MRLVCQLCLFATFVSLGYAAFACLVGCWVKERWLQRTGIVAGAMGLLTLTAATLILSAALVTKDFRFAYVVQYCSRSLPWFYSLSALWVGQSGSLLLWSWLTVLMAMIYRLLSSRQGSTLCEPTFGLLMFLGWFLVTSTVFAVDPAAASLIPPSEGHGLSPLLQHPAMLIHPPVIFLGYAAWSVPLALAIAALWTGRLDETWIREARRWALFAWAVLGSGILLGAAWAYGELGWGGYWGWDPVENGSLLPWLTGTALIHALMMWQHVRLLKKTAVTLAVVTFGLCCFATFLTRSGIFSSVHAFSQSSIGWLFLALMFLLAIGGAVLLLWRRDDLRPENSFAFILSRETMIAASMLALTLLTIVICCGTISTALSSAILDRNVIVGAAFYNNVLTPTGLMLLFVTGTAPLLKWGAPPTKVQQSMLWLSAIAAVLSGCLAWAGGVRDPLQFVVIGLAGFAVMAMLSGLLIEARRRGTGSLWQSVARSLWMSQRKYAGFLAHLGFYCLAIGVTCSARGAQQREVVVKVGESIQWSGYTVRLVSVLDRQMADKLIAEAHLEFSRSEGRDLKFELRPEKHYHLLQREWTTEVAVHSNWSNDIYTILHGGENNDAVHLTLRKNPMMRSLWMGGSVMVAAAFVALFPKGKARRMAACSAVNVATAQTRPALTGTHGRKRPTAKASHNVQV